MNICKIGGHKIRLRERKWKRGWGRWEEECVRCGANEGEELCGTWVWRIQRWLKQWREKRTAVQRWFRPCGDCGRRFGLHDEHVDHVPF